MIAAALFTSAADYPTMRLLKYSCKNEAATAAKNQSAPWRENLSKLPVQPCFISLVPSWRYEKQVNGRRQLPTSINFGSIRVCEAAQHPSEAQRTWLKQQLLLLLPRTIRAIQIISANGCARHSSERYHQS